MTDQPKLSPRLREAIDRVKGKRPRTVIEHILKHGQITTEELKDLYGYEHPPRAARDVREAGVPLETIRVTGTNGRSIGAYRFADIDGIRGNSHQGRVTIPRKVRQELYTRSPSCAVCGARYEARYFQVDHRVPYEVSGDDHSGDWSPAAFQLLCGSCQRTKSWTCESCPNWGTRDESTCQTCYWAQPDAFTHVATESVRQVAIAWTGQDVADFDAFRARAEHAGQSVEEALRNLISEAAAEYRADED